MLPQDVNRMIEELDGFDSITEVSVHDPFEKIYGSRVIIIGAGPR